MTSRINRQQKRPPFGGRWLFVARSIPWKAAVQLPTLVAAIHRRFPAVDVGTHGLHAVRGLLGESRDQQHGMLRRGTLELDVGADLAS